MMMSKVTALALLVLALCALTPTSAYAICEEYGPPEVLGTVTDPRVNEASGLAASARYPGVLWAHNDSGDGPTLYALRSDGTLLGRWTVQGASAVDWEDLAMGPCDDGQRRCLYIGDIGNNGKDRTDLTIYKVEEPDLDPLKVVDALQVTKPAIALPFRYPFAVDDIPDAETLMVSPLGTIYIVTKEGEGRALKMPAPLTPGVSATLELVATTNLAILTGGDLSPTGDRLVVRNYLRIYELLIDDPEDLSAAFINPAHVLTIRSQPQGETMTYLDAGASGMGMVTLSEKTDQPLIFYPCINSGLMDDVAAPDMSPRVDMSSSADMAPRADMASSVADLGSTSSPKPSEPSTGGCAGCASSGAPLQSPPWALWGVALIGAGVLRRRRRR